MKLGDFLNTLAQKGKIEIDLGTLSNVKLDELNKIELDDTIVAQFDSSLMSLDGAKNNPEVLNHFKPIILKAVDNKFAIMAEKFGLGEDFVNEKNTYKKTEMLESKIESKFAELEAQKGKGSNPEEKTLLTKQISELQSQLNAITETSKSEKAAIEGRYENEITDMFVNNHLSSKKFATKELPIEINTQIARTLIDKQLKALGAKLIRKDGELKLVQEALPDMDFYQDNKAVSYADFTNKVLADNKLLEVSNPNPAPSPQNPIIPLGNQTNNTSKFDAAIADAMK